MNLTDALHDIANQLALDYDDLQRYADEDTLGGFHYHLPEQKFTVGSIWGVEGQVIYALIRALAPDTVVEIGGWYGCSASHMAAAVKANGHGWVISVDDGSQLSGIHGSAIPDALRAHIQLIHHEGLAWLDSQEYASIDLIFEDANHSTRLTYDIAARAYSRLKPGGILVNHDVAPNSEVGDAVRKGLDMAGIDYRAYLIEPSNCGLAIWRKPEGVE